MSNQTIVIKDPTKEGYLLKRSRILRTWKRRWFVLQDNILYSFKKEREYKNPTEIIDLRVFTSVKSSEDETNRAYSFNVYSPDQCFSLVALDDAEKETWIREIGRTIVLCRCNAVIDDDEYDDYDY